MQTQWSTTCQEEGLVALRRSKSKGVSVISLAPYQAATFVSHQLCPSCLLRPVHLLCPMRLKYARNYNISSVAVNSSILSDLFIFGGDKHVRYNRVPFVFHFGRVLSPADLTSLSFQANGFHVLFVAMAVRVFPQTPYSFDKLQSNILNMVICCVCSSAT